MKCLKVFLVSLLLVSTFLISALAVAKENDKKNTVVNIEDNSEQKAIIIANIHAMWKAIETDNLKDYMQYIHPQYTLFGEGDVYLHKGKDKEQIDIGDFINRAKGVRTFMHQPEVSVRSDTAWITYYWSDAGVINGQRYTSRGKSTRIFVRENGKWLCIHSHFTEVP